MGEGKFDQILEELKKLDKLSKLDTLEEKIDGLEKNFKHEYNQLKTVVESQKKTIINLDRRLRMRNIIIHGLQVKEEEDLECCVIELLKKKVGVNINASDIEECAMIGKEKVMIKVSFLSMKKKKLVMENKHKLKECKDSVVFIVDDLPLEIRQQMKARRNAEDKSKGRNMKMGNQHKFKNKRTRSESSPLQGSTSTPAQLKQCKLSFGTNQDTAIKNGEVPKPSSKERDPKNSLETNPTQGATNA